MPVSGRLQLIDPATHRRAAQWLAIHLFRLYLLSERVHEFVLLPERLPFFPKLNVLGNERLAVWILRACLIGADELLVLAMGEHDAIESVDDDIEIAIGEWAALPGNVGIGLCTVRLDGGHRLVDHRNGIVFGCAFGAAGRACGADSTERGQDREFQDTHEFLPGLSSVNREFDRANMTGGWHTV